MFMKRPLKIVRDTAMNKAKDIIDNLMETFSDYEIEHILAELEVGIHKTKAILKVKMTKKKP